PSMARERRTIRRATSNGSAIVTAMVSGLSGTGPLRRAFARLHPAMPRAGDGPYHGAFIEGALQGVKAAPGDYLGVARLALPIGHYDDRWGMRAHRAQGADHVLPIAIGEFTGGDGDGGRMGGEVLR